MSQPELLQVDPFDEHYNEPMDNLVGPGVEGDSDLLDPMAGRESGTYSALEYEDYVAHFESGSIGVLRLERDLYVVQGWDANKRQAKVRRTTRTYAHPW